MPTGPDSAKRLRAKVKAAAPAIPPMPLPRSCPARAGVNFGDSPVTMREDCNFAAVWTIATHGFVPATASNSTCLPAFSAR